MNTEKQNTSIGLIGQHEVTVLEDGRIKLPSHLRRQLENAGVHVLLPGRVPGLKALVLCPEHLWHRWVHQLQKQFLNFKSHPGARVYCTPCKPITWDSQGRISLPALAYNYAGIKAEATVFITGMDYYLEIWAEEEFSKITLECERALLRPVDPKSTPEVTKTDARCDTQTF